MKRVTKQKTGVLIGLIYLVAFAIFNMLVFFIFKKHNNVFWTSYAFMTVAFLVQMAVMFFAFRAFEVEAVFFGIPLASLSFYYFFAAIFAGAVFMIFQGAPFKLAFALQVIILVAFVVVAVITLLSRDYVQDVSDNIRESAAAIKMMHVDVESLLPYANDPALKTALRHLSETVRYSDPMSNSSVTDIEEQIMEKMDELRLSCETEQTADALAACKQVELLFQRRNRTLKASK